MIDIVLVPRQRLGVLIGAEGKTKKEIEKRTKTHITVAEEVVIEGEALDVLKTKEIVRAIGRGFSPEKAFHLLSEDYQLYIITMEGEKPNTVKRIFARIIGKGGRTREKIEQDTECFVSVFGKTVSIIGKTEDLPKAADAVEFLLSGKSHSFVYGRLEHSKNKME